MKLTPRGRVREISTEGIVSGRERLAEIARREPEPHARKARGAERIEAPADSLTRKMQAVMEKQANPQQPAPVPTIESRLEALEERIAQLEARAAA